MEKENERRESRFVIPASEVEEDSLSSLVSSFESLARTPISNFRVAAVGLGASGRVFVGVNVEFPGLPFHHTIHAEQFLLANMFLHTETALRSFAVSAAPCGHCRQFLQELRRAPDVRILITSDPEPTFTPLSHFLARHFGPHHLLPHTEPLLLEPRYNALALNPNPNPNPNSNSNPNPNPNPSSLVLAALEAANRSHAPYSKCPSGVAVLDSKGGVFKGSYIESAAYNPSLGPVQAALVGFICGGGGDYSEIVEAVLVEKDDALIKQDHSARLLLHSLSPHCLFHTFLATSTQ